MLLRSAGGWAIISDAIALTRNLCSRGQSTSPTSWSPNGGKVGPLLGAAGAE